MINRIYFLSFFIYLFIITLGRLTPLRTRFCTSQETGQHNAQILEGAEPSLNPKAYSMCEILIQNVDHQRIRSKSFTLHTLSDLFIPRPSKLIWEAFSHAAIARSLFVHMSTTVCMARYTFIQLSELWQSGLIKLASVI